MRLCCRATEERGLLVGGVSGGDALEGVPQDLIAAGAFVHREIAPEHRSIRLEMGSSAGHGDKRGCATCEVVVAGMGVDPLHPQLHTCARPATVAKYRSVAGRGPPCRMSNHISFPPPCWFASSKAARCAPKPSSAAASSGS